MKKTSLKQAIIIYLMNSRLKGFLMKCTAPIRWALHDMLRKDITVELQRLSLLRTAEYVERTMMEADSVKSPNAVLDVAIANIALSEGLVLEFGVYTGATINHIASQMNQQVFGFDSFEGLPERWRNGFQAGEFKMAALPKVLENVQLVKGWFNETLPDFLRKHPGNARFLHIDCDLYSSTVTILTELRDRIIPGTVIAFNEYFNYPGWEQGEFKAFQEFCCENKIKYKYLTYNSQHEQVAVKITEKG